MNAPDRLAPPTRKKVERAIKHLGYEPNLIASSLKSRRSTTIGIVVSDIQNPFFVRIIKSAERRLKDENYTAIICDSEEDPDKEAAYLRELFSRRVDGLIIIPALERNRILQLLGRRPVAAVFVDRYLSEDFDCIKSNNQAGMSLLISHLIARGYREIGLIGGPLQTLTGRERHEAYMEMMRRHNLPVREGYVQISDFSADGRLPGGPQAAGERRQAGGDRRRQQPDRDRRPAGHPPFRTRRFPADIGLVIFDEVMLGDLTHPPLTVVVQPAEEMGQEAAKLLIERMRGPGGSPPQLIVHEPKLLVRRFDPMSGRFRPLPGLGKEVPAEPTSTVTFPLSSDGRRRRGPEAAWGYSPIEMRKRDEKESCRDSFRSRAW